MTSFSKFIRIIRIFFIVLTYTPITFITSIQNILLNTIQDPNLDKHFIENRDNDITYYTYKSIDNPRNIIIFLHGGGYAFLSPKFYFNFINNIYNNLEDKKHNTMIILPDYPKTPQYTYPTQIKQIYKFYINIKNEYPEANFIIMGDSAGGNLAIELVNKINASKIDNKDNNIRALILLSPWIITDNPLDKTDSKKDILNYKIINRFRKIYINNSSKYKSTLEIDIDKFPKTLIRYGSQELLKKDIVKFSEKFTKNNIEIQKIQHMPHSFDIIYNYYTSIYKKTKDIDIDIHTKFNCLIDYIQKNLE